MLSSLSGQTVCQVSIGKKQMGGQLATFLSRLGTQAHSCLRYSCQCPVWKLKILNWDLVASWNYIQRASMHVCSTKHCYVNQAGLKQVYTYFHFLVLIKDPRNSQGLWFKISTYRFWTCLECSLPARNCSQLRQNFWEQSTKEQTQKQHDLRVKYLGIYRMPISRFSEHTWMSASSSYWRYGSAGLLSRRASLMRHQSAIMLWFASSSTWSSCNRNSTCNTYSQSNSLESLSSSVSALLSQQLHISIAFKRLQYLHEEYQPAYHFTLLHKPPHTLHLTPSWLWFELLKSWHFVHVMSLCQ